MLSNNNSMNKMRRSNSHGKQPNYPYNNNQIPKNQKKIKSNIHNMSQSKNMRNDKQNIYMISQCTQDLKDEIQLKKSIIHSKEQNSESNNLDNASLVDMIELLKQYEKVCLDKQDFSSADEAKNKIDFLKAQQLIMRREELENQDKQNIQRISKEGEQEIKMFQQHWDEQLQELIQALKQVQSNLTEQHQKQIIEIEQKLEQEEPPRVKFSPQVLQLRKHLTNLIKVKNYKEAELTKAKLEAKQKEQIQKWNQKFELRKKSRLEIVIKKQQNELKALRTRLQAVFNEKLKERDQKFQILLKKNRKRRIQSGKMSRERLKTKTAIMNESKSYMQSTMGAIGTGSYKF